MTEFFKANENIDLGGMSHTAGSIFSLDGDHNEEINTLIADGKITNVAAPETITESEATEAEAGAISREEAMAQGVDVDKVEAEAETVDVVPDPKDDDASSESSDEASTETAEEPLG